MVIDINVNVVFINDMCKKVVIITHIYVVIITHIIDVVIITHIYVDIFTPVKSLLPRNNYVTKQWWL